MRFVCFRARAPAKALRPSSDDARRYMMRGDIFEDPGQGADLDRVMVGNSLASKLSLEVGRQVDRIRKDKWR